MYVDIETLLRLYLYLGNWYVPIVKGKQYLV